MREVLKGLAGATVMAVMLASNAARADVVSWYNGDLRVDGNGVANVLNADLADARVYDDFVVTNSSGWTINRIWSNNLMSFTGVTQADCSIRSGVSPGNGGTTVASGTSAATQTSTGRLGLWPEYTVEVAGLSIYLPPGTYWLQVTPVGFGVGGTSYRSYNSLTSGASSVGTPAGNDDNSFFSSGDYGMYFSRASVWVGVPADFSMGVAGSVTVPEPGTFALLGLGLAGLAATRRRKQ